MIQRNFINILSDNVDRTALFYERNLGMRRHFDSDWFVILTHDQMEGLEYGILKKDHDVVPEEIRSAPAGMIVTFVVDDCDEIYKKAIEGGVEIIQEPTDMFYGQRRLLLRDPEGTVLDISAPVAPVL